MPNKLGLYTPEEVAEMLKVNGKGPTARTIRQMRIKAGGGTVIAKRVYFTKAQLQKLIENCREIISPDLELQR